jgi:hypothetical protein
MRVCLVGSTNPWRNPQLVREADTLVRAGHSARVAAIGAWKGQERDESLLRSRGWRLERIDLHSAVLAGKLRSVWMRGRRRLASTAFQLVKGGQVRVQQLHKPTGIKETGISADGGPVAGEH